MPGKRQTASSARLMALNSMWASAWTSIARPAEVTIERRPTRRGGTSSGLSGRPGMLPVGLEHGAGIQRQDAGGMQLGQRRDAFAFAARVGFKQGDQCACAQLGRSGHRVVNRAETRSVPNPAPRFAAY
jgi:hypothetical protein